MQNQPEVSHITVKPLPGLFTEFSARQALTGNTSNGDLAGNAPRYINGQLVRFWDGRPQKIGGWVNAEYGTITDAGGYTYGIIGVPRAAHAWDDLNGQEWIGIGTASKLYLLSLNQLYDITPLRRQVGLTNAIATTLNSAEVVITDPLNNATIGDYVNINGAQAYEGITLNGQYEVVGASTNTITVTAHQTATGTGAGGGGLITLLYDITAGLDSPGFYYGWGSGVWSQDTWGTPRSSAGTVNTVGGTQYVGVASQTGTIVINGTATDSIETDGVAADDLAAVAAAINAITGTTDVTATVFEPATASGATWTPTKLTFNYPGSITLSNSTGQTITVAYTGALTPANTGVAQQGTYPANEAGMVQPVRLWALDNWGQGLMASIRDGSVYYWNRSTGPNARAVSISTNPQYPNNPGAPVNTWWTLVSPTNQQLICLGASHDGINDGLYIAISDTDDYTDFTPTDTNSAYTGRLSSGSKIVTGKNTRTGVYLQTDTAPYLLTSNATSVYGSEQLGEKTTILSPNAAIPVGDDIYVMGLRKFYNFDGVLKEIPCDVWAQVFNNFNYALTDKVTSWYNDQWSEVWWFYPSATATENDSYVIYNYRDKHWSFGQLQRTAATVTSQYYNYPLAMDAVGNVWQHENGVDQVLNGVTTALNSWVQTYDIQTIQRSPYGAITPGRGLAYNEGAEQIHLSFVVLDIIELTGNMYMTIKTKRYPRDAYITKGPYIITPTADLLSVRARGKLANFTYGSNTVGSFWRIADFTFGTQDDGER
jgi:hypothetical protein